MLAVFASLVTFFLILVLSEILWRTGRLHVESSRKIIHIATGLVVASWPHYMSWMMIELFAMAMLAVVIVSHQFHVFKSIHSVKRLTIGEILYPMSIGICALLQPAPWVFTVAILHLTLADGAAAIVGHKYGARSRYMLLSHGKSLAGSLAFFVVSFLIFVVSSFVVSEGGLPHLYGWFLWGSIILTGVENISWYGSDDLTVPLAVIVILTAITG